jgi:glycosyltransferase involved in cell wall biosynthesis
MTEPLAGSALLPPTGTVLVPAFNEAETVEKTLVRVAETLAAHLADRVWEIIVVDDGSSDDTAMIAEGTAARLRSPRLTVRVLRHVANRGLGGALQTGFAASTGEVVVVVDCDLSYHPDHIPPLVRAVVEGKAQIAVASPYMPGGSTIGVPRGLERRSRLANRFLALLSRSELHTFTGMVRAYHGPFVRALPLRSVDDVINVEALYKTGLLHGRIVEVPATLDWRGLAARARRTAFRHNRRTRAKTYEMLVRGVLFRPYLVFAAFGLMLFVLGGLLALFAVMLAAGQVGLTVLGISMATAGFSACLVSVLSVQVKRGFEELYYQQSAARGFVNMLAAEPVEVTRPDDAGQAVPTPQLPGQRGEHLRRVHRESE